MSEHGKMHRYPNPSRADDLYEGQCEAGCQNFHGGEIRHTPGCGHYGQSLTKFFEDRIRELEAERDEAVESRDEWKRGWYILDQDTHADLADARKRAEAAEAERDKLRDQNNTWLEATQGVEALIAELSSERDRLRGALEQAGHSLHEIESGDMSTFEAQDAIRAALQTDTDTGG